MKFNKRPTKWHEDCLKNSSDSEKRLEEEFKRVENRLLALRASNTLYRAQLSKAEEMGLTEFDSEYFDPATGKNTLKK